MEEKYRQFMRDRYGVDQLSLFLVVLAIVVSLILYAAGRGEFISPIMFVLIVASYVRVMSRNRAARAAENGKFLSLLRPFVRAKRRIFGEKGNAYFPCPSCKKELRVPKGKGEIKVRCPHCKNEFKKKT